MVNNFQRCILTLSLLVSFLRANSLFLAHMSFPLSFSFSPSPQVSFGRYAFGAALPAGPPFDAAPFCWLFAGMLPNRSLFINAVSSDTGGDCSAAADGPAGSTVDEN